MSVAKVARKLGLRRTMTPNQIVAYNVAKARELRGWTQEQAAEALAPYLGAKLSGASFSSLERSAWSVDRIKQFSADDLLALSRGFDLPIGFFFTPPPPELDAALHAPDAPMPGLDPIVILNAILGTPENLDYWRDELLAYASSTAPPPQTKRRSPTSPRPTSPTGSTRSPRSGPRPCSATASATSRPPRPSSNGSPSSPVLWTRRHQTTRPASRGRPRPPNAARPPDAPPWRRLERGR